MTLQVRDKEFDITFVNNYVREQYQEILSLSDEISELPDQIEELEKQDLSKSELKKELKKVNKKRTELIKDIAAVREDIVRELLETNGYEYDVSWWAHKTDANDINDFMLDCIMKDVSGGGTKKK